MQQIFRFAQKGLIFNKKRDSILLTKYLTSKYVPEKLNNKYAFPGGRMVFGEEIDASFMRKVFEETGVQIKVGKPIYLWTWQYQKDNDQAQNVGVIRLAEYQSGEIIEPQLKVETTVAKAVWLKINEINPEEFVDDESPVLKLIPKYQNSKI